MKYVEACGCVTGTSAVSGDFSLRISISLSSSADSVSSRCCAGHTCRMNIAQAQCSSTYRSVSGIIVRDRRSSIIDKLQHTQK